ncbi:CHAT domain-containing protein [Saccharothrix sp. S26]|uniref:CHAT domain-containing protein n=1 Tax=Saccharothrix sp. S26 TaxID=2907215 RepID=UPI001F48F9E6|nr:CHAT domain-containing protein [Saccharothrix sp. S26]MCE6996100.1 CHAT domain-containing protein [Saccharothrix sp. S26]
MPVTAAADEVTVIREARELHRSGLDATCAGRHHEAARLLRRGQDLADAIDPVDPRLRSEWLATRIRLSSTFANVMAETDGPAAGLDGLAEARRLIEDVADPDVQTELLGRVEHNRGLLLLNAGFIEEAITAFDAALEHKERRLAAGGPVTPLVDLVVKTLRSRGTAHTRLGSVRQARQDLTRAIALATEHGLLDRAADANHAAGLLDLRVGDLPAALRRYELIERSYREQGLDVPVLLGMDRGQALITAGLADEAGSQLDSVLAALRAESGTTRILGNVELHRAVAAFMTGDLDLALTTAASARQRMRRWGCETCVANATLIGLRVDTVLALRSGRVPRALPGRALDFADSLPVPRLAEQAALARMLAARLEVRRGDVDAAQRVLDRVPRPGKLTPIDHRMLRRLCRAELAVARGRRSAALAEIRAGLTDLDHVRDRVGGLELLSGTALHGRELAELAVRLVLDGGNARRLFSWLERTRAQTYRYEPLTHVDPELAERIAEVRSLTQSIHQAEHDGHSTAALRGRRAERLREANRLGWHTGRWGRPRPVAGLTDVMARLGERALVSFASSEDDLVAVVVVDSEVRLARLGSAERAAESARMLNADLNALAPDHLPEPLAQVMAASARKQADRLDAQLIRPLAELIGGRELVVVPTGALYAVPWGVLPTLHGRPTVVAPSATAWLAAERAEGGRSGRTVLVRGPGLPAAVGEIDKLGAHYGTAALMSGGHASVSTVLEALDGAEVAHLAAHGVHEPENALFSRLELTDGPLYAHEMAGLAHPPRQVVLAACELALNRIRPGDEPLGFASALLASGSQMVVAPLSRVGDQACAAAMDDYHRSLAAGARPAVALADAIAVDPLRRPFVCLGSG